MKVLKKMLAVAVSVATMAMSVSAFAATYDAKTNSVAMTAEELTADGKVPAATTGQMTVVVVPKAFGSETMPVTADNIYYINQEEFGAAFTAIITNMGLKGALDTPTNYEVRVGGANLAAPVKFDITVEGGEVKFELGNVDGNYKDDGTTPLINSSDASYVLQYFVGSIKEFPHPNGAEAGLLAANVDGNYKDDGTTPLINSSDASYILQYFVGSLDKFPAEQ